MVVLEPVPQLRLMPLLAQRRSEYVLGALESGAREFVHRQQQVLRAGFRERRQAAVAGLAHLVQRVLTRKVHDVHRRAGHLSQGDGAMHRLGFGCGGPRERVINGRRLALRQRAPHDHVDHAAVFGMHADERSIPGRLRERFEDGRVIHHQHARIGHEQFEAGYAFVHHGVHIFQAGFVEIGHDHVQAVIDGSAVFGLLPPDVESVAHLHAARLDGEIDQGSGASEGRRARAGFEIVAGGGTAEGHVEMCVDVDAARQQQHAGRVDHPVGRADRDVGGNLADLFAVDHDVGRERLLGCHHRAVSNECDQRASLIIIV